MTNRDSTFGDPPLTRGAVGSDQEGRAISLNYKRFMSEFIINKWLITVVIVFCFAFAFLYTQRMGASYTSSILLKVERSSSTISGGGGILSMLNSMNFGGRRENSSQYEKTLIGSSYILGRVISKLKLDISARPRYFPIIGGWVSHSYHGRGLAKPLLGLSGYAWGGQKIKIGYLKVNSEFINKNLTVISGDHGRYQVYSGGGQKILDGEVGKLAMSSTLDPAVSIRIETLKARVGDVFYVRKTAIDGTINGILSRYKAFDAGNPLGRSFGNTGLLRVQYRSSSPRSTILFLNTLADTAYQSGSELLSEQAAQTLSFLNKQLPITKRMLKDAEMYLSGYQAKTGNMNMTAQFNFVMSELSKRQATLEDLELNRTELMQRYTPEHPFVITLNKKIAEVKKNVNLLNAKLHKLPISDIKLVELLREVKTKTELYTILLNRKLELTVMKAGVRSNIRILSYAAEPPLLERPKKIPAYIISFIIGLFLCFVYLIVRIAFDDKVGDGSELEEKYNLDVAAKLPYCHNQKTLSESMSLGDKGDPEMKYLVSEVFPREHIVESFRSLCTRIKVDQMEGGEKVYSFCSLLSSAGKSFTSINVAYLLSELGHKVLLIDMDLRKGYLHKYLKCEKAPGLTDLLEGKADMATVVRNYGKYNLNFIPRGGNVSLTANALSSPAAADLMQKLRRIYDIVIIDTAPINLVADGILALRYADSIFMLLPAKKHTYTEIKAGVSSLLKNNLQVPKVIMNYTELTKSYYGYKEYYGKHYQYYGESES